MKIIKVKDYNELSKLASEIIIKETIKNPNIILGFATGKTPFGTYNNLVKAYKNKKVDFSKIKTFNLDEYYPIKKGDKKSYNYYMFNNLFNKINVKKENINILDGTTKNCKEECRKYEDKIKKSNIDLQILGIGVNGHIGFNEPGSEITTKTRLIELTQSTINQNRYKNKALTMGISTILKSKKIILLASGKKKAEIIYNLINGKIDKSNPSSFLKKHKDVTIIIDKEAGSLL